MSIRIKSILWLYFTGSLLTLIFQVAVRLVNCVGLEACYLSVTKGAVWSLIWPLIWGLNTRGSLPQSILISVLILILLFVVAEGLNPVFASIDSKRHINILPSLYVTAGLVTFPFQVGIQLINCGTDACNLSIAKAAVWSLFWPLNWGMHTTGLWPQGIVVSTVLLILLFALGEGLNRAFAATSTKIFPELGDEQNQLMLRSELTIAACALIALLAAEWVLTSVSRGMTYGNEDGKMAQAVILTALKFGGWFEVTNINPIQGIGSQLLPFNVWANPAYWPFAIFSSQFAADVSGIIAFVFFAIASYLMARCFNLPALPSMISAQLSILLFVPAAAIFGFLPVYAVNPGLAVVYAPHMLALGILARLQPCRLRNFVPATSGISLLILYGLYCDPLWTMVSGISWAVPFAVVALSPLDIRGTLVRLAALGCCVVLLFLSGALEYAYTLSQYTSRVQFSDLLHRLPSLDLASVLFSQPVAVFYYGICLLGWILGFLLLHRRRRVLVVTGLATFTFFFAYAAAFLLLPGHWWLPLPIYVEHSLFPLFTTAAIAGLWSGMRAIVLSAAPAIADNKLQVGLTVQEITRRLSLYRLSELIHSRLRLRTAQGRSIAAAILVAAFVPSASLILTNRAHVQAEATYQPWPNEPEIGQFFADNIGLGVGRRFRGSVTFWPAGKDAELSMDNLWVRSIPTSNEYSQLVTPQAIYLNSALFKKDVSTELNRFMPWISNAGSYEVLFKTLQALGVRYIVGYEPFPAADERHFLSNKLPRRTTLDLGGDWQIYEFPDPNLGDYSPTEIVIKELASEVVATLAISNFDFRRQVVLSKQTEPLVPARNMHLSFVRGGMHISGHSDATSLVLLPQQFSHCLRAHDSRINLVRANLIMTAVVFSGNIDTAINFDYGIFAPRCRRADLADIKQLRIKPLNTHDVAPLN